MLAQHERPTIPPHAVSQLASTSPAAQVTRPDTVKAGLTPKRPRRHVENDEYSAFVRRILRAYSRRAGDGDVEALALMLGLAEEIDAATAEAVKDLRDCGYSWAEIGARLGITRQAAQQRWGNGEHGPCHTRQPPAVSDGHSQTLHPGHEQHLASSPRRSQTAPPIFHAGHANSALRHPRN